MFIFLCMYFSWYKLVWMEPFTILGILSICFFIHLKRGGGGIFLPKVCHICGWRSGWNISRTEMDSWTLSVSFPPTLYCKIKDNQVHKYVLHTNWGSIQTESHGDSEISEMRKRLFTPWWKWTVHPPPHSKKIEKREKKSRTSVGPSATCMCWGEDVFICSPWPRHTAFCKTSGKTKQKKKKKSCLVWWLH